MRNQSHDTWKWDASNASCSRDESRWERVKPVARMTRDETLLASKQQEGLAWDNLLERALSCENMADAWKHVKAKKGSAGPDVLSTEQTFGHPTDHWPKIRSEIKLESVCSVLLETCIRSCGLGRLSGNYELAALIIGAGNGWWCRSLLDIHGVFAAKCFVSIGIPGLT